MSLVTGDFRAVLLSDWEVTGQVVIQQDYPLPCTILEPHAGVHTR